MPKMFTLKTTNQPTPWDINMSNFKDGDLVQSCNCGWETPEPGEAVARCPQCSSRVKSVRVEKKAAPKKVPKKSK